MKNNILLIIILTCIFSCKKDTIEVKSKIEVNDTLKTIKLPLTSEILVYDKKDKNGYFIYDKTFKKGKIVSGFSRIYGKYVLKKNLDILVIEKKPSDDEHTEPLVILYAVNNNKKIDSLTIYETIEWEGSYTKRFKINSKSEISIINESKGYDFDDEEKDTIIVDKKNEFYKINDFGKFIKTDNSDDNALPIKNNIWKGTYLFEASNKDDIKTSFEILINSLEDISLTFIEGNDKFVYKSLKSEKINDKKIKIIYNPSYEDNMGIIYIEKLDDQYYISGNPIYFINPGTSEGMLKKIK